jgi:hypothetical protein
MPNLDQPGLRLCDRGLPDHALPDLGLPDHGMPSLSRLGHIRLNESPFFKITAIWDFLRNWNLLKLEFENFSMNNLV